MNNPVDIANMYGLNKAHNISHTNPMGNSMYPDYAQMNNTHNDMYMQMQSRDENTQQNTMQAHYNTMPNEQPMHSNSQMISNNKAIMPLKQNTIQGTKAPVNILVKKPYVQTGEVEYMNDLLRTHIGKMAEVEFLIGTENTHIRRGQLTDVGTNYIVLKEYNTGRTMIADFYNIKFVTLYDQYR